MKTLFPPFNAYESRMFAPLEGLRGFAAIAVMLFHLSDFLKNQDMLPGWIMAIVQRGWIGVDIFFVLSGFLLSRYFLNLSQPIGIAELKIYFSRRILRIAPAYHVQLVILFILTTAGLQQPQFALDVWLSLLVWGQSLLFPLTQPVNPVYWTLPTEWAFYLVLPLIVLVLRHNRVLPLLIPVVIGVVAFRYASFILAEGNALSINDRAQLLGQFPCRVDQFVWGACTAWAAPRIFPRIGSYSEQRQSWISNAAICLGLAGIMLLTGISNDTAFWYTAGWAIIVNPMLAPCVCLVILGACIDRGHISHLLGTRPLVLAGTVSYSLYLWHFVVMSWFLGGVVPDAFRVAAALVVTLLISTVSYILIERPFLNIRNSSSSAMNWINKKTIPFFLLAVVLIGAGMIFARNLMPLLGGQCSDMGGIDRIEIVMREQQRALITGWVASKGNVKGVQFMSGSVLLAQPELVKVDAPPPSSDNCTQRRMSRFQAAIAIGEIPPSTTKIDVLGMSADQTMFLIHAVPFHPPVLLGNIDLKKYESGNLIIEGWALSATEPPLIQVLDKSGQEIAKTETGIVRIDVAQAWPAWARAGASGFKLKVPVSKAVGEDARILVQNRHGDIIDLSAKQSP